MNKTELIEAIAASAELTKSESEKAVNELIKIVVSTVHGGEKVTIPGFGTFSVSDRKARTGRNPQTGEAIKIKASKAPKFTAGSGFKTAVNEKVKAKAKPAAKATKAVAKAVPAKKGK